MSVMSRKLAPDALIIIVFLWIRISSGLLNSTGNLGKYLELSQALKYGDECSWEAEEYRQNFTVNRLLASGLPNFRTIMEMANTMVERDYKLCSGTEIFVCDKESQKCVCGDPSYEALIGANRSLYTLESGNKCRWDTNTYCVSDDYMLSQKQLGLPVDAKCKNETICRLQDGNLCSIQGIMRNLLETHGMAILFNPRRVTEEVLSGNICSCIVDQVEIEDDLTSDDN